MQSHDGALAARQLKADHEVRSPRESANCNQKRAPNRRIRADRRLPAGRVQAVGA